MRARPVFAYLMHGEELHGIQIEHRERVILFAGNERQPIRLVESDAMRVLNARRLISASNLHRSGLDGYKFIHSTPLPCWDAMSKKVIPRYGNTPDARENSSADR
jgi:hypothetical protein